MQSEPNTDSRNAGYALIVVLSTLLVLVFLFTSTTKLALRNRQLLAGEQIIGLRDQQRTDMLDLAIAYLQSNAEAAPFSLSLNGQDLDVTFQDVGGLIDLNTAAPVLLDRLFSEFALGPDARDAYVQWRQTGRRFVRPADFARVTGLDSQRLPELTAAVTVFSGRQGVARDHAPAAVLDLIGDPGQYPETPASGVNYRVIVTGPGQSTAIGVVSAPPAPAPGQILEF